MACPIADFLTGIDPSDRDQFRIIIDDRTRHVDHIARSLRSVLPDVTGTDVLDHRRGRCGCESSDRGR